MKNCIKNYLEKQVKKDDALRDKYHAEKLDDCVAYINNEARKYLSGKNGYIEDEVVYKWARDFYLDNQDLNVETKSSAVMDVDEEENEIEIVEKLVVKRKKPAKEKKESETDNAPIQLSLFDL